MQTTNDLQLNRLDSRLHSQASLEDALGGLAYPGNALVLLVDEVVAEYYASQDCNLIAGSLGRIGDQVCDSIVARLLNHVLIQSTFNSTFLCFLKT